jgi:hypothetical protein
MISGRGRRGAQLSPIIVQLSAANQASDLLKSRVDGVGGLRLYNQETHSQQQGGDTHENKGSFHCQSPGSLRLNWSQIFNPLVLFKRMAKATTKDLSGLFVYSIY